MLALKLLISILYYSLLYVQSYPENWDLFSSLVAVLVLLDSSSDFIQTHPYPGLKKIKGFEKLIACSMTDRR